MDPLILVFGDSSTPITAGTGKASIRAKLPFIPAYVDVEVPAGQSSGPPFALDVNRNDLSLLSTKLTIPNGDDTSLWAPAQPVLIASPNIGFADKISVDVDNNGAGTIKGPVIVTLYDVMPDIPDPPGGGGGSPPEGSWLVVETVPLGSASATLATYSMRHTLAAAALAGLTSPSKVRVTVKGLPSGSCTVNRLYVGQASSPPTATSLVPLTFSGVNNVTIPANTEVVSDEIAFAIDTAKGLMMTFEPAGAAIYGAADASWSRSFKTAQNASDDLDGTGFQAYNSQLLISKVEVFA